MALLDLTTALDFLGQYEHVLGPFLVLLITYVVALVVSNILRGVFDKTSKRIHFNKTQYTITARIVVALIWLFGIISAISLVPELSQLTLSLFAGAGVLAIIIGFAAQKAASNIIGGVTNAMYQPFRVGDRIKVKDIYGKVEDITLRDTVIRTNENARVIIPNSIITEELIFNHTIKDEKAIKQLDFGISYDSDIDLARAILQSEVRKHPDYFAYKVKQGVFDGEQSVVVKVAKLDDSAVVLRLFYWAKDQKIAD
ncbi:MAG TPA: mechanosensitive ion channel, partial [Candidatus Diapherotrites archaeon]|nr:mechanosensitive ion channel [Candidatus Diapherotrites archaeon]